MRRSGVADHPAAIWTLPPRRPKKAIEKSGMEAAMIRLSNGHRLDYVVASGSLAFDGRGWLWEKPLVSAGLIRPELFTVVLKTLTRQPRAGNLKWHRPWDCVRLVPGGAVNKVGLTNPGIDWWVREIGPGIDYRRQATIASIFGETDDLVAMAKMLDRFDLVGVEVNPSCPNTGHGLLEAEAVVAGVEAVRSVTRHPVLVKVSAAQDYRTIARKLVGTAQAVALNSVPWERVFPDRASPLRSLEARIGGGGGGVSGRPAQALNWRAVAEIAADATLPVIAPSIMAFADLDTVRALGARAVSFGAIHLRTPWLPTTIVRRDLARMTASSTAERAPA